MNAFSALADDTRRQIVLLLAKKGELPVNEIKMNFNMTPPAVSQHLKILKEAKVIQMKKHAQRRLYSINESGLHEIEIWLTDVRKLWSKRLDKLDQYLAKMKLEKNYGK